MKKLFCPLCGSELYQGKYTNDTKYWSSEFPLYKLTCLKCEYTSPIGSTDYGESIIDFISFVKGEELDYETLDGELKITIGE